MRHRLLPVCLALWLTASVTGCGGGSADSASAGPGQPTPPAAAPTPVGTALAKVSDTSGVPLSVPLTLTASNGSQVSATTNAAGEARFPNVPAGKATLVAYGWNYYGSTQEITVVAQSEVSATFSLEPRNPTTAVVLGSRVVSKGSLGQFPGARVLEFEVDIAVLDPSGQPLTNLSDAAFELQREVAAVVGEFIFGPAANVAGPDGWIPGSVYEPLTDRPKSFGLQPARAHQPIAVGLLVDQGAQAKQLEPRRSAALAEFLAALGGNDSALLAEYRGMASDFTFTPSGGFVTDGRSLLPLAEGLPDRLDSKTGDPIAGTQSMLNHLAQQSSAAPKALVALTAGGIGCAAPADKGGSSCQPLVERSRAAGIPITTMSVSSPSWEPGSQGVADLARRTGGAAFFIDFPAQYRTAMRGLLAVVGGETPFYRARFAVNFGSVPGFDVLAVGNTLYAYLDIRVSERDVLDATLVVPL